MTKSVPDQLPLPPDAVTIPAAARLLGLHPERIRQLIRAGVASSPARGHVALISLLRGYTASLRAEAERPQSDAVARSLDAKAQMLARQTFALREQLVGREEAVELVGTLSELAVRHLGSLSRPRSAPMKALSKGDQAKLSAEIAAAKVRVEEARDRAVRALRTGCLDLLEGAA